MHPAIARIQEKLETARQRVVSEGLSCRGDQYHFFTLGRCATPAEVDAYEAQHGVSLPEEYRQFVLYVGNGGSKHDNLGGVGPYYGMYELQRATRMTLGAPCPLTPDQTFGRDTHWYQQLGLREPLDGYQGTRTLGTRGLNEEILLIVTGPARGRVVYTESESGDWGPYFPPDRDFLAWYERWLDELLAGWNVEEFGYGLAGTEAEFVALFYRAEASLQDRQRAVEALERIPKFAPQTIDLLLESLTDSRAEIRLLSLRLLVHTGYLPATNEVFRLLADPNAAVRCRALEAAAVFEAPDWPEAARALLQDPSAQVVEMAILQLGTTKRLQLADLEPLLASSSLEHRRAALNAFKYVEGYSLEQALPFVADESPEIRFAAVHSIARLADPSPASAALLALIPNEPSWQVLHAIALVLAKSRRPGVRQGLMRLLEDPHDLVRRAAQEGLRALRD